MTHGMGINHARNHGYGDVATSPANQHTGTGDVIPLTFAPANYAAGGGTLGDHLSGIDTVLAGPFTPADHGHTAPGDGGRLGGAGVYAVGDLLYADGASSLTRLVVGASPDGNVLTLAGGVPTWAAAGGGGGTLDAAYDFGGAGAGRIITVDSGAVALRDILTTGGTFLQMEYTGAGFSPTGTHNGLVVDFETTLNVIATTSYVMNNLKLITNTVTVNTAALTVTERGLLIDADASGFGGIGTGAASTATWRGIEILMPTSASQSGGGTVTVSGIRISGATSQVGSPTVHGLLLENFAATNQAVNVTSGQALFAVGSVANPGIAFSGNSTDGFFHTASGINVSDRLQILDGTSGAPAISFTSDATMGLYSTGAGIMNWRVGAGERFRIAAGAGVFVLGNSLYSTGTLFTVQAGVTTVGGNYDAIFVDLTGLSNSGIHTIRGTVIDTGVTFSVGSTTTVISLDIINDTAPVISETLIGTRVLMNSRTDNALLATLGSVTLTDGDILVTSGNLTFGTTSTISTSVGDIIISPADQLFMDLTDNLANAADIREGTNVYQRFITTNGGEAVQINPGSLDINFLLNSNAATLIQTDAALDRIAIGGAALGNENAGTTISSRTQVATVGVSQAGIWMQGILDTFTSGTHPILAGVWFSTPSVTSDGATVTDAATFYISGAPTIGTTNHAILIASGGVTLTSGDLDVNSGITTLNGALNIATDTISVVGPTDLGSTRQFVELDASSNNVTVRTPNATGSGRRYTLKRIDGTANTVTIDRAPASSDTFDGATSLTLVNRYDSITIVDSSSLKWSIE